MDYEARLRDTPARRSPRGRRRARRDARQRRAGGEEEPDRRRRGDAWTCVETKILRRVRAESSRCPSHHRRDACSWRGDVGSSPLSRPSQDGGVIAEK